MDADDWFYPSDRTANKERAELVRQNHCGYFGCRFANEGALNTEWIYTWDLYIPLEYKFTSRDGVWQIMGQLHDQPAPGEAPAGRTPAIAFRYLQTAAGSRLRLAYGLDGGIISTVDTPLKRGEWHTISLHVRFSRGSDGFARASLDGVDFPVITGPNAYNNEPTYLRLGLYRGGGQRQTNTLYYDNFSLEEVAP